MAVKSPLSSPCDLPLPPLPSLTEYYPTWRKSIVRAPKDASPPTYFDPFLYDCTLPVTNQLPQFPWSPPRRPLSKVTQSLFVSLFYEGRIIPLFSPSLMWQQSFPDHDLLRPSSSVFCPRNQVVGISRDGLSHFNGRTPREPSAR